MKNLLNILGILLFIFSIISCGNESTNDSTNNNQKDVPTVVKQKEIQKEEQILKILKKESLFYAKSEQFEYLKNSNLLNITKIVFSPIMPENSDSKIICKEILKFIGEEEVVFTSNEEVSLNEERTEEYMMKQKGEITIGATSYSANIYFNDSYGENETSFKGKIVFSMPSIKSLNGESFSIGIKGVK
ncbi:MAG: hypothetical protein HN677_05110 [Flavobacteriales bacterium]|jgi:hypothetical protein|nr:hypothetical protein [Flavobacteriales bacterium]